MSEKISYFLDANEGHLGTKDRTFWYWFARTIADVAKDEMRAEMDLRLAASKPPAVAPQGDAGRLCEPAPPRVVVRDGRTLCEATRLECLSPRDCVFRCQGHADCTIAADPVPHWKCRKPGCGWMWPNHVHRCDRCGNGRKTPQATVGHGHRDGWYARVPTPNAATYRQGEQPTHSWEMTLDEIPVAPQGLPVAGPATHTDKPCNCKWLTTLDHVHCTGCGGTLPEMIQLQLGRPYREFTAKPTNRGAI